MKPPTDPTRAMAPAMALALAANFGSVECWRGQFAALGRTLASPSGALALAFEPRHGRLVHRSAPGLDTAAAAAAPVVVEYVRGRDGDVDAFVDGIDWAAAYQRYQDAVHAASEPHGVDAGELGTALLLDVRRAAVFEQAATRLPGARWLDPAAVADWAASLPTERDVVVYCVYGHDVGRATALRLRAAGVHARFLRGGIDGWQAAGRAVEAKKVAP